MVPLPASGIVSIGRGSASTVQIADTSVSRKHAVLRIDERITIEDLASTNGTWVGIHRLRAHEPRELAVDELARIGAVRIVVHATAELTRSSPEIDRRSTLRLAVRVASPNNGGLPQDAASELVVADPPTSASVSLAAGRKGTRRSVYPPPSAESERKQIIEALTRAYGNQAAAAKLLGMSRRTLINRLEQFNLPRPRKRREH